MARLSLRAALLLASVFSTSVVYSTAYTWTGSAGDGEWTNSGNWTSSGGTFPQTSSDTAAFTLASNLSVDISSPVDLNTLTATNNGGSPVLTLSGAGSITFFSGGISAVGKMTVNAPTTILNGANTFSTNNVSGNAINFGSSISESPAASGASITFNGGGTINYGMSSANTYTGQTTVSTSSTTLNINSPANVVAIPGNLRVNAGAKVIPVQNDVIATSSAVTVSGGTLNLLDYTGSPTFASLTFRANGVNDWPNLPLNLPLIFTNSTPLTVGGATLQADVQLTFATGGTIAYDNSTPPTSVGQAVISSTTLYSTPATLTLQGTHPANIWTFNVPIGFSGANPGNADMIVECTIADGGTLGHAAGISKTGTGILQLTGTNTYLGPTSVSAGTLSISSDANLGTLSSLTLGEGVTLQANGSSSLILTPISLSGSSTGVTFDTNSNPFSIASVISGSGPVTKISAGTLTLSGANLYTGSTSVNAGTLAITNDGNIGTSANSPVLNLAEATTLQANGASSTLSSSTTINLSGTSTGVTFDTNSNAFSIASNISGSGPVTKISAGALTLSGANSYTGSTSVNTGTLAITSDGNIGTSANSPVLNLAEATTLQANGASSTLSSSTTINLSGTSTGVTFDTNSNAFSIASNISGSGPVTKISAGALTLSGANSYTGSTSVNTGTLAITSDSNLGTGTSALTLSGGTTLQANGSSSLSSHTVSLGGAASIDTNSNPFAISSAISGSGPLTKISAGTLTLSGSNTYSGVTNVNAGTLAITSDSNLGTGTSALTLSGGTTLQANGSSSLSSHTVSLGGAASIDTNSNPFAISSAISGSGPLAKISAGTLTLSGSNTYSGVTNVNAGTLAITSDSNLGTGTSALTLSGGTTLQAHGSSSLSSHTVSLGGAASIDTNSNPFAISSAISGSGSLTKISAGTLTLTGSNNYTGGTTVSAGTLQGTTLGIQGAVTNNSAVVFDQTITGTYAGNMGGAGTLTKQNTGIVILTGSNNYSGGTTVSAGTLQGTTSGIQGAVTNNSAVVFDQTTTGTYAGNMGGTGTLTKQNIGTVILTGSNNYSGATSVTGGRLSVNGTLSGGGAVTVGSGATLGGTGTVHVTSPNNLTVDGTLAPGNSIGTLNVTGNVVLGSGATFQTEINAAGQASLLDVTGSFTIGADDTLFVTIDPGIYPATAMYTVVDASAGVTGQFATLTTSLPTFRITVSYPLDMVVLTEVGTVPFSTVVTSGNAGAVAACVDTLSTPSGSDAELVIAELRQIPTVAGLVAALDAMQPSQFTALALAQESAMLYMSDTIFYRLRQDTEVCPVPCKSETSKECHPKKRGDACNATSHKECPPKKRVAYWITPYGGYSFQKNQSQQPGFHTKAGGVATGFDLKMREHWTLGAALGYSYDHLKWKEGLGNANIQDGFGAVYASCTGKYAYLFGAALGSYDHYKTARHIEIGEGLVTEIDRTAHGSHNGWHASGHLQGGLLFGRKVQFSPFIQADYIYIHENSFNEHGASSLDLHVDKKNSDLLEGEAGIQIARCFSVSTNKFSPSAGISVIREWRFMGKYYKSHFEGSSCVMKTTGMNPDRTLISPTLGMTFLLPNENRTLSFEYKGKYGEHFQDNRFLAQFLVRF